MGGSPSIPETKTYSPQEQVQAQISLAQEEARLAEEARQRQAEYDASERERLLGEFNTNLGTAYNAALGYGQNQYNQYGYDQPTIDALNQGLVSELDRIRTTVPSLDPSPGNYFSDNIADIVANNYRDQQARQYGQQVDQFAGTGFANNLWDNTADDAILQGILAEQYEPAAQQINNAYKRGSLNQTGFDTALSNLDTQRTAALSNLQSLGQGVLSGYRENLGDIGTTARDAASNYQLGSSFDPSQYQGQINSLYSDQQGRLEGDIRNTVGNDPLFDINSIISGAGARQGATAGNAPLLDAFYSNEQNKRNQQQRGLGSQGVF